MRPAHEAGLTLPAGAAKLYMRPVLEGRRAGWRPVATKPLPGAVPSGTAGRGLPASQAASEKLMAEYRRETEAAVDKHADNKRIMLEFYENVVNRRDFAATG